MPVELRRVSYALALVALVVACTRKADGPSVATAAGHVELDLTCDAGNFTATIKPWRVRMSNLNNGKGIRWKLKNSTHHVALADIDSVQGRAWPFKTKKFRVAAGDSADGSSTDLIPGQTDTLYNYKITTVCTIGGQSDTIVIDPDMIIPPRTAR